jgi:capsular polysaccharide biosynthesis protein
MNHEPERHFSLMESASHTQSELRRRGRPEPLENGDEFVFERTAREDSPRNREVRQGPPATPPRRGVGLGTALRRYPVLALLPVVILAAAGITLGLRRAPTYTASTTINVGSPDIASQATPGYVQAEQTLASAYSREVTSQFVYGPVAKQLGISQSAVASRLSSSAVPSSPTFTINATGPSQQSAIRLAQTATAALQHYINVVNQGETTSTQLLNRYRNAEREADRLSALSGKLDGQNRALPGSVSATRRQEAHLAAQVAQLKANALSAQYSAGSTTSRTGASIQVLNPATAATSDRRTTAERYGVIGAAAGLVLGAALALLVANLRRRRWAADDLA